MNETNESVNRIMIVSFHQQLSTATDRGGVAVREHQQVRIPAIMSWTCGEWLSERHKFWMILFW